MIDAFLWGAITFRRPVRGPGTPEVQGLPCLVVAGTGSRCNSHLLGEMKLMKQEERALASIPRQRLMYNQAKNTCTKTPSGRTVHSNMFDSTFDREEQSRAKANGRKRTSIFVVRSLARSLPGLPSPSPSRRPSVAMLAFPFPPTKGTGGGRLCGAAARRADARGWTDGGTNARENGTGEQVGS